MVDASSVAHVQQMAVASAEDSEVRCVPGTRHRRLRSALQELLEAEGFTVVGAAADGPETLTLLRRHRPSIALVELEFVLAQTHAFVEALGERGSLVVYGAQIEPRSLHRLLAAASQAVALITLPPTALLEALREARAGRAYLDPALSPGER